MKFVRVRALGAKMSAGNGGLGISFNGNELALLMIDKLPASDAAIGTDRARDFCAVVLWLQLTSALRHCFWTGAIRSGSYLFD